MITLTLNSKPITVEDGTTVAAAILNSHADRFRTSVAGEHRSAVCGMGICFECGVTINGVPNVRGCMILCENGMEVITV